MERMTRVGIVRACSFDELPQVFNILLGQMSFIGPRPLLVRYLPLYSTEQARRHDVLPVFPAGAGERQERNYIDSSLREMSGTLTT